MREININQKGFAHIVLLIVVIALSVAGYFAYQNYQLRQNDPNNVEPTPTPLVTEGSVVGSPTPTSTPTADWETYSSSVFSFKYPSDFKFEGEGFGDGVVRIIKTSPGHGETSLYDGVILYFELRELPGVDPVTYSKNELVTEGTNNDNYKVLIRPESMKLNDYNAATYTTDYLTTNKIIVVQSPDGAMIVDITNIIQDPNNLGYENKVDQILSTFQFTDPPVGDEFNE